ncbi:hypothetical protein [Microlunatus soli]|uniref:Uncharacterized protein n=1 Tax=Microlunatus soli TaxID=630515 RepID=A0A1H1SX48_9ACTN|nr:hypothetical protein [Microlunatus soli]SDS52504.1 hypothetical protein SAMN04489812_2171 [Microlunatus soli]
MSHRNQLKSRIVGGLAAAIVAASAAVGVATPAHAYSPNPSPKPGPTRVSTDQSRTLTDPVDNTYFHKDPGGYGAKIELRTKSGHYIGKVEFHPYGEKAYVYDTSNDSDSFYVILRSPGANPEDCNPPKTPKTVDLKVCDLSYKEGKPVYITVYDNQGQSDELAMVTGNA